MSFLGLISRTFSVISIVVLFLICLTIIKYYILDFFHLKFNESSTNKFFLEVNSSNNKLKVGKKIYVKNHLFIGSQKDNDVVLKLSNGVKVEIFIKNNEIFLRNLGDSQCKVGNKYINGNTPIFKDEIIEIDGTTFQVIQE